MRDQIDVSMPAGGHQNCAPSQKFQLGEWFFSRRRIEAAIRTFDEAQSLGFDPDRCGAYRWQCWMLLGDFENAWRESNEISQRGVLDPDPRDPDALWDGLPLTGKRILIRCLHGYGDAIQFLRYAQLLRERAVRVMVETHPEMVSLLERIPFIDEVSTWARGRSPRREDWDQQIEVTELPRAFGTTIATIPADIPYLNISRAARLRSARKLGYSGLKKRIGLLWSSSTWNPVRSMPLTELRPLLGITSCVFYSFQRDPERAQLIGDEEFAGIHDTSMHSPEIVNTAADLLNMDLLITVDTMAAHLAGALGKPVWTMLPFEADWRWLLGRRDTPWYPTMRLFRQPARGDWQSVVVAVRAELERFAGRA